MDKCVSKGIGNNTTHPFVYDFPLFLIALDGIRKSASSINKSPNRKGLENRLHTNRPDGEIGGSFEDRDMGNNGVVGLEIGSNIKSSGLSSHLCKK